ncbi:MAG: hypothetical protein ACKOI2_00305 [Actinomycetota bacterium]
MMDGVVLVMGVLVVHDRRRFRPDAEFLFMFAPSRPDPAVDWADFV